MVGQHLSQKTRSQRSLASADGSDEILRGSARFVGSLLECVQGSGVPIPLDELDDVRGIVGQPGQSEVDLAIRCTMAELGKNLNDARAVGARLTSGRRVLAGQLGECGAHGDRRIVRKPPKHGGECLR